MTRSPLAAIDRVPTDLAERYQALGYWTDETIDDLWRRRVEHSAEKLAFVGATAADRRARIRLSYTEAEQQVGSIALQLQSAGVHAGDRVIVHLPNCVDHPLTLFAIWRLGALPVFALAAHRTSELTHIARTSDAAAVVTVGSGWGAAPLDDLAEVAARLTAEGLVPPAVLDAGTWDLTTRADSLPHSPARAEDVALLQLSGGTTGTPKLIPRTHRDYLYSVRDSGPICGVTRESVLLVALPASHNFPMSSPGMLGMVDAGGTTVIAPDPLPRTAFALIESEQVTHASLVPPLLQAWLNSPASAKHDLSSLQVVGVGGARLADAVAERVRPELGAQLQQVFGMAEGLVCYTRLDDPDELVTTTQGQPISRADEIRVVDDDDQEVPPGEEGHLLTRGPYTIRGYYRAPEHNLDAFTADGFYRTGDLVRQLPSGHLVVTGRTKDQINRGGEKIAIDEIEGLLLADPRIRDAVLVGLPDEQLGEKTCAVLVAPELDRSDVVDLLRGHGLAAHKIPDRVVFVDSLPTTGVGKNSRRDLRRIVTDSLTTVRS